MDAWFIEQTGLSAEADGLSRTAGRLFGALLFSAEPQSLDALVATLRVSKASVSIEARRLVERGVIERAAPPPTTPGPRTRQRTAPSTST